ncbi:hypothetical protein BGW38_007770, partial [Lunasporangiospora selenospora]
NCFLSSDRQFVVPTLERDGTAGFSFWDHEGRKWSHTLMDKACSCHEESVEKGNKVKVKKDRRVVRFSGATQRQIAVVHQSYRSESSHGEEALDTVVYVWTDEHGRNHITSAQLLNRDLYACHDIHV